MKLRRSVVDGVASHKALGTHLLTCDECCLLPGPVIALSVLSSRAVFQIGSGECAGFGQPRRTTYIEYLNLNYYYYYYYLIISRKNWLQKPAPSVIAPYKKLEPRTRSRDR